MAIYTVTHKKLKRRDKGKIQTNAKSNKLTTN